MKTYSTAQLAAINDGRIARRYLVALFLDGGTYGFAMGMVGSKVWNTITFNGSGRFLEISGVSEVMGIEATNVTMRLFKNEQAGLTSTILSTIFAEQYRNRPVRLYSVLLDTTTWDFIDNPEVLIAGYLTSVKQIEDGEEEYLEGMIVARDMDFSERGWEMANDAHHQKVSSGDTFFKHTAVAATVPIYFGQAQPASTGNAEVQQ
jgi:hypothetical protein